MGIKDYANGLLKQRQEAAQRQVQAANTHQAYKSVEKQQDALESGRITSLVALRAKNEAKRKAETLRTMSPSQTMNVGFNESKVRLAPEEQAKIDARNAALVDTKPGAFVYGAFEGMASPMKAVGNLLGYKETNQERSLVALAAKNKLASQMDVSKGMGAPQIITGHSLGMEGAGKLAGSLIPFSAAEQVAGKVLTKVAPKLAGMARNVTRGAMAGSAIQGLDSAGQGKSAGEVASDVALGAVMGVGADVGLGYLGKAISRIRAGSKAADVIADMAQSEPTVKVSIEEELGLPKGSTWAEIETKLEREAQAEDYYRSMEDMQEKAQQSAGKPTIQDELGLPKGMSAQEYQVQLQRDLQNADVENYYKQFEDQPIPPTATEIPVSPTKPTIQEELGLPKGMSAEAYQEKLKKDMLADEADRYYKHLEAGGNPVDFKPYQVDNGNINPSEGVNIHGRTNLSETPEFRSGTEGWQDNPRRIPEFDYVPEHTGAGRRDAEILRRLAKKEVRAYKVKGDPNANQVDGFIKDDVFHYNKDSNESVAFVGSHEMYHDIKTVNPAHADEFAHIENELADGSFSWMLDDFINTHYDNPKSQAYLRNNRKWAAEEMLANVTGDIVDGIANGSNMVNKYDPQLVRMVSDGIESIQGIKLSELTKDLPKGTSPGVFSNGASIQNELGLNPGFIPDAPTARPIAPYLKPPTKPALPNIQSELFPAQLKIDPKTEFVPTRSLVALKAKSDAEKALRISGGFPGETPLKASSEITTSEKMRPSLVELRDRNGAVREAQEQLRPSLTNTKNQVPKAQNMGEVVMRAPNYKDVGTAERWTTDVYRVFQKVFGQDYDVVKRFVLDPFDAAKKARVQDEKVLTDALKKDIVDGLGIKKGSKESALVMRYGEGHLVDDELLKEVGYDKADKIKAADQWFRAQYDKLIEEINAPRIAQGKTPIPKRQDYYRHYIEMSDAFSGIKNIFDTTAQISPKLVGLSEYTRPGEKWAGFKQRRITGTAFTEDAVGGFLDYVKAGTYAKHIDPEIQKFRDLETQLKNATEGTKNMNNFVGFLNEFTDDLSGKTNMFDRTVQELIGRKAFHIINALNSRIKSNAVLGNVGSALAQVANLPQSVAYVKDPRLMAKGLTGFYQSLAGKGHADLYKQSGFLQERISDVYSQFDTKWIDQPKKMAAWLLQATDEVGTKSIWSSVYEKGLAARVADPIKYADDVTRSLVAGRGIGEVPILQKSKLFQVIAPFTYEVNNLWKVQKDFARNKDFAGIAMLFTANFVLNNVIEDIRGSRVTFDPIKAIGQGFQTAGDGVGDKLIGVAGGLAGEVLSNVPLGQYVAAAYPEYGKVLYDGAGDEGKQIKLPSRQELFGKNDPTRFGVGVPLIKAFQDPVKSLVLPFGGTQLNKTLKSAETLGLMPKLGQAKHPFPASYTPKGELKIPVTPSLVSIAKGLTFGEGAIPEVRDYYKRDGKPISLVKTPRFEALVADGMDEKKLYNIVTEVRKQGLTKKDDIKRLLINSDFSHSDWNKILSMYYFPPDKK